MNLKSWFSFVIFLSGVINKILRYLSVVKVYYFLSTRLSLFRKFSNHPLEAMHVLIMIFWWPIKTKKLSTNVHACIYYYTKTILQIWCCSNFVNYTDIKIQKESDQSINNLKKIKTKCSSILNFLQNSIFNFLKFEIFTWNTNKLNF